MRGKIITNKEDLESYNYLPCEFLTPGKKYYLCLSNDNVSEEEKDINGLGKSTFSFYSEFVGWEPLTWNKDGSRNYEAKFKNGVRIGCSEGIYFQDFLDGEHEDSMTFVYDYYKEDEYREIDYFWEENKEYKN
jgi:hypothetical protein